MPQVDIGRAYTAIQRELGQVVDAIHPVDYVRRFCNRLGLAQSDVKVRAEPWLYVFVFFTFATDRSGF